MSTQYIPPRTWENMQRARYKPSNKHQQNILIDEENYEYRVNKRTEQINYYICRHRKSLGCKATAVVKTSDTNNCTVNQTHTHGSDNTAIQVERIVKTAVQETSQHNEVPPRNVVSRILSSGASANIPGSCFPSVNTMKARVHRARQKINGDPPIPKVC